MSNSIGSSKTIYKYYPDNYNKNYTDYENPIDLVKFKAIINDKRNYGKPLLFYYRYSDTNTGTYTDWNNSGINKYLYGIIIKIYCDKSFIDEVDPVTIYKYFIRFNVNKSEIFFNNNGEAQMNNKNIKIPDTFTLAGSNVCSNNGCLYKYISREEMIKRDGT